MAPAREPLLRSEFENLNPAIRRSLRGLAYNTQRADREALHVVVDAMTDFLGLPRIDGFVLTSGARDNTSQGIFGSHNNRDEQGRTFRFATLGINRELARGAGSGQVKPEAVEVIAHEVGHYLEQSALTQASPETRDALHEAFQRDIEDGNDFFAEAIQRIKRQSPRATAYSIFQMLGGVVDQAQAVDNAAGNSVGIIRESYVRQFTEWHAQRTANELERVAFDQPTRGDSTLGDVLSRHFSNIVGQLRALFDFFRSPSNSLPALDSDLTFQEYIRGVSESVRNGARFELQNGRFNTDNGAFAANFQAGDPIDFIQVGRDAIARDAEGNDQAIRTRLSNGSNQSSPLNLSSLAGRIGLLAPAGGLEGSFNIEQAVRRMSSGSGVRRPTLINSDEIPDVIRAAAEAQSPGASIKGFTDQSGESFIVRDNIVSEQDLQTTFLEEAFHQGLPTVLGSQYTTELGRIFRQRGGVDGLVDFAQRFSPTFTADYRQLIATVQAEPRNREARYQLVEEAISAVFEAPQADSGIRALVGRTVARIKRLIRRVAPSLELDGVSDSDLFLLARTAARSQDGRAAGIRFRLSSTGTGVFVRDDNGRLVHVNKDGVRTVPNFRERTAQGTRSAIATALSALNGTGEVGVREGIRDSNWYHTLQQTVAQVHSRAVQFDQDIRRAAPEGFYAQVVNSIRSSESGDYLEARDLLASILDEKSGVLDQQQLFQPGSELVTYLNRARTLTQRRELSDGRTMQELTDNLQRTLSAIKLHLRVNDQKALETMNTFAVSRHTPDRNRVMWYRAGAQIGALEPVRQRLLEEIDQDPSKFQELVELVDTDQAYDESYSASGFTNAEAELNIQAVSSDPELLALLEQGWQDTLAIRDATNEVNQAAGRTSASLENRIAALDWQDTYITLQGQAETEDQGLSSLWGQALDQSFRSVEGRETVPDALGATVAKAQKAYEYLAAQEVAASVAVNVAASTNSQEFRSTDRQRLFTGTVRQYNVNSSQYKSLMKSANPSRVIYFNPDNARLPADQQTALVINLGTETGRDAIKGRRSDTADNIAAGLRKTYIPQATSFISSLKTYRNLPFIPYDLIRTSLTFAYNIGTDEDFGAINEYFGQLLQPQYTRTLLRYSRLLATGDFAGIREFVESEGPNSLAAELDRFIEVGGQNNFLDSIRLDAGAPEGLEVAATGGRRRLEQLNEFFTQASNMTDLMGRFAYYQVKRNRGVPEVTAAADALNLANFGSRGTWSGPLGGLFQFFRATASGAVGQLNNALNGDNLQPMMIAAAGAGAALYSLALAMSDEDDEGNNLVADMNGGRFIRDFSFRLGDEDRRFGLGFGPVAVAISSGVQVTRAAMGHQSIQETADNIISSTKDNAAVLPLSGISATENPIGFVLDSAIPSILQPTYQAFVNLNGLGFEIYQGAANDPYDGRRGTRGRLEEDIAIQLTENNIIGANPDLLAHLARSYTGTLWQLATSINEVAEELTDPEQEFDKRRGNYIFSNFYGPETFTQTGSDFYDVQGEIIDRRNLIRDSRRAGRSDFADQLESDERYQQLLPLAEQAERRLRQINKDYAEEIWNTNNTPSERGGAYSESYNLRFELMQQYIREVSLLGLR